VAIAIVVVPLTAVMIVFGELLPKVLALRHKEWVCLCLSPAMGRLALGARPVVWLVEAAVVALLRWGEHRWQGRLNGQLRSEAAELLELRALAALARSLRLIGSREEAIILGAARLSSHPVREILLPAEHMVLLGADDAPADALAVAYLDMHTRFPVAERAGDPQSIIGYVTFKDIVAHRHLHPAESSLRGILRPIPSLQADSPLAAGLERLIRERTHIALIRDASETVLGMITLEDILEELVGEIEDEYDPLPGHAVRSGAAWVVGGGVSLAQLKELTGIDLTPDLPRAGVRHLSGWVTGQLGRPPRGGDVLQRAGLRIQVRKVRRQQVLEAQVSPEPESARPPGRVASAARPP
jgi:putative hemolysin